MKRTRLTNTMRVVHSIATTKSVFDVTDLPPTSSRQSWNHILSTLLDAGKLVQTRKAAIGRYGWPAQFKMADDWRIDV